jgi:hypothetical protein
VSGKGGSGRECSICKNAGHASGESINVKGFW